MCLVHPYDFYARRMSETSPNPQSTSDRISEQLKTLFAAVVTADLAPDEKGRWHQRLIAITNTTKRDLNRAAQQLERFVDEWNASQRGTENAHGDSDR